MSAARNDTTVLQIDGVRRLLADRDVELPEEVFDSFLLVDRIVEATPQQPSITAVRELYLSGVGADKINAALLADLAATKNRTEHAQAHIIAAKRTRQALLDNAEELHTQLAALAAVQISHLEAVADLDGATLDALVRDGRHDDAQALVGVDVAAAELVTLWDIRDTSLWTRDGAQVGQFDCSRWRDPRPVERLNWGASETLADRLIRGLRAGGELWYPTQSEAVKAAEQLDVRARQAAASAAAQREPVGHVYGYASP